MKTTYNILSIDELSYSPADDERMFWFEGELSFSIKFTCRDKEETIFRKRFKSYCRRADSTQDVLRICIEKFLNKAIEHVGDDIYMKDCNCIVDRKNIHQLDVQLQEPFKSLFNDLFDKQKWEMPQGLLPEESNQ